MDYETQEQQVLQRTHGVGEQGLLEKNLRRQRRTHEQRQQLRRTRLLRRTTAKGEKVPHQHYERQYPQCDIDGHTHNAFGRRGLNEFVVRVVMRPGRSRDALTVLAIEEDVVVRPPTENRPVGKTFDASLPGGKPGPASSGFQRRRPTGGAAQDCPCESSTGC